MLPRATNTRTRREAAEGRQSGRTQEIQRLIGRSLRAVVDLAALGERTLRIDCDVLQADGGTRCASITGACVALADAIAWCRARGSLAGEPLRDCVAAVSVGIVDGEPLLDLDYAEDSGCDTDMNVVMTGAGGFVEVQGTAEGAPFSRAEIDALLDARANGASRGCSTRSARRSAPVIDARSSSRRTTPASCASSAAARAARHRGASRRRSSAIPEADEPHVTFVENALAKARHASALSAPAGARRRFRRVRRRARRRAGRAQRALRRRAEVRRAQQREARRGAAGRRRSARALLLRARAGAPRRRSRADHRRRRLARHDRRCAARRGGFGYDPHFEDAATGLTGAELPLERKNELSHRGKAMRALIARLDDERQP